MQNQLSEASFFQGAGGKGHRPELAPPAAAILREIDPQVRLRCMLSWSWGAKTLRRAGCPTARSATADLWGQLIAQAGCCTQLLFVTNNEPTL